MGTFHSETHIFENTRGHIHCFSDMPDEHAFGWMILRYRVGKHISQKDKDDMFNNIPAGSRMDMIRENLSNTAQVNQYILNCQSYIPMAQEYCDYLIQIREALNHITRQDNAYHTLPRWKKLFTLDRSYADQDKDIQDAKKQLLRVAHEYKKLIGFLDRIMERESLDADLRNSLNIINEKHVLICNLIQSIAKK